MFISLMYDRNIFMFISVLSEEHTVYRINIDKIHYRYTLSLFEIDSITETKRYRD